MTTTEIDQSTAAIISEQNMIQQNRKHRNEIYNSCIDSYLVHLDKQIQQLQSTEQTNLSRNKQISSVFETVYEKIVTSSNITLRKIKQTAYEKKLFWENLIKNNASFKDLELKKSFYLQKRDAEDRYYDAISQQKAKKIPYTVLLGKNKKKDGLKQWQQKNRVFEQKVNKGTATLNQWRTNWDKNIPSYDSENYYRPINEHHSYQISTAQNFASGQNFGRTLVPAVSYESNSKDDFDFLKNFEKRK